MPCDALKTRSRFRGGAAPVWLAAKTPRRPRLSVTYFSLSGWEIKGTHTKLEWDAQRREQTVDRAMHELWVRAERRIDASLALIMASMLWLVVLPLTVMLTDLEWSRLTVVLMLASIPICCMALWPLKTGLMTVRAIEERDGEEVARWRETLVPPAEPQLVKARLRRVHYPMLAVIAGAGAFTAAISLNRWAHAQTSGMSNFSLGVALGAVGVALGACVLMFAGKIRPRSLLLGLILVGWAIPAGGGAASLAVIVGRQDLESALAVRTLTTVSYVIFGLIGMLVSLLLFALWLAWLGKFVSGKSLEVNHLARAVPVLPEGRGAESAAESEFDAEDLDVIKNALSVPGSVHAAVMATLLTTLATVGRAIAETNETAVVTVLGAIAACCASLALYLAVKV